MWQDGSPSGPNFLFSDDHRFNGLGEYTMINLLDNKCTVQARTQKLDDTNVRATIFGAVLLTCPPPDSTKPRTSIEVKMNGDPNTGMSQFLGRSSYDQ